MNEWYKSSYSENAAQCVELRHLPSRVQMRDTQNRTDALLSFSAAEWAALVAVETGPDHTP